jgi:hypothetical protein
VAGSAAGAAGFASAAPTSALQDSASVPTIDTINVRISPPFPRPVTTARYWMDNAQKILNGQCVRYQRSP